MIIFNQTDMKKSFYSILLILLFLPFVAEAKITVHGSVYSSKGKQPIVGAIIHDKDGQTTTSSDVDGNFTITVDEGTQLNISSVGYKTKTVKVKSENMIVYLSTSNDMGRTRFFAISGGMLSVDDSFKDNLDLGIMGGSYWKNWGVYGRLSLPIALGTNDRESKIGIVGTVGAIRNITNNVRIFAGVGIGFCLNGYYLDYAYPGYPGYYPPGNYYDSRTFEWETETQEIIGVPFELGVQWNIKHINMMAGLQFVMNTAKPSDLYRSNFKPFVGVGYSF